MPSCASTPPIDSDDEFRGMLDAMDKLSPVRPAQKRTHDTMASDDNTSDDNNGEVSGTIAPLKRLRGEQLTEIDVFLKDPPSLRETKMMANLLALGNRVEKIVTSKAGYEVSADLETNIYKYAPAVLLSSKVTVYKGESATAILLTFLKKYRFDIPPGLENVPAAWAKITAVAQEALTQKRSNIKKAIRASVHGDDPEHQNIFDLAKVIVKGTQCTVNVVLCAHIALMGAVYLKVPGPKFWDKLDVRLAKIRKESGGDAGKIARAFRHILTVDQDKHGAKDYDLDEKTVDDFQQKVDDLIDVGAVDAATSAQADTTSARGASTSVQGGID
ncbi:hypothetical protein B0H17DRAFT_1197535 [Mycena rosella]|uniref:Uncharacterized protein n=1 Tax=Mycena rosella TaxID=1033263 RepID=A0AAD7DQQ3_MYCRO|nr:hypothetical protein B0H17DRAFT_1197535 [Mycena rosella]